MGKVGKRTKKFLQKVSTGKASKTAKKAPKSKRGAGAQNDRDDRNNDTAAQVGDMSMDDFLASLGAKAQEGSGYGNGRDKGRRGGASKKRGRAGAAAEETSEEEDGEGVDEPRDAFDEAGESEDSASAPESGSDGSGAGMSEEDEEDEEDESDDDDEIGAHKEQLEALAKSDPDFYKFLKENDKGLLDFDADDDGEGDDGGEDEDGGEDADGAAAGSAKGRKKAAAPAVLDEAALSALATAAFDKMSVRALKRLVSLFRQVCSVGDEGAARRTSVPEDLVEAVVVHTLTSLRGALDHHVFGAGAAESPPGSAAYLALPGLEGSTTARPGAAAPGRWAQLQATCLSALRGFAALLALRSKDGGGELSAFLLDRLRDLVPYLLPFPRLAKAVLKAALGHWARSLEHTEGEERSALEVVRLRAFLAIRELGAAMPPPFLDLVLKGAYLTYVRRSRAAPGADAGPAAADRAAALAFMATGIVELYGMDLGSGYQYGFAYIRQLALHLRTAYAKKTREAMAVVLSWQFLSSLRLWTLVLSKHSAEDGLRPLIHPLAQVVLGTMRLVPSLNYAPLTFHCARLLQRLAAASGSFMPVALPLLEVLQAPELSAKQRPSTAAPPDLAALIRIARAKPKARASLATRPVQAAIVEQVLELVEREVELYRYSIAMPEFAAPICARLRAFAKATRTKRWRALARGTADKAQAAADEAQRRRRASHLDPLAVPELEALLPEGKAPAAERLEKMTRSAQKRKAALMADAEDSEAAEAAEDAAPAAEQGGGAAKQRKSKAKKKKKQRAESTGAEEAASAAPRRPAADVDMDAEDEVTALALSDDEA